MYNHEFIYAVHTHLGIYLTIKISAIDVYSIWFIISESKIRNYTISLSSSEFNCRRGKDVESHARDFILVYHLPQVISSNSILIQNLELPWDLLLIVLDLIA